MYHCNGISFPVFDRYHCNGMGYVLAISFLLQQLSVSSQLLSICFVMPYEVHVKRDG